MIKLDKVGKIYGKKENSFVALSNINLELPSHKTIAIVGKSGSGKSTLLHLLGGLDRPSEGTIMVNDQDLNQLPGKDLDRYRSQDVGFVFQSFFIEAKQSCYQNICLPLEVNRVPFSQRHQIVEQALADVDLSDKLKSKAGDLSGGQKQRLVLARAIVTRPKLILADEPTGNLDSATGGKIIDLLFDLHKKQAVTLIIVTHDKDLASRCDIAVFIKDGTIEEVKYQKGKQ